MKKRWHQLVPHGQAYHVSHALDERRMPIPLHGHDFAEVFWVREGSGIHRVNGRRVAMASGDLVFIRPSDRHGLAAAPGARFRLENVAFPRSVLTRLRRDYFPAHRDLFWDAGRLPKSLVLDSKTLARLNSELDWLRAAPRDRFSLDCFLLQLIRVIGRRIEPTTENLPAWLADALKRFETPDHLQTGSPALARLAGRSSGHVGRLLRKAYGASLTAWVNRRRLEYAARLLESTHDSVTEIAAACGFENLSYFHRLFRANFGITPRRYRARVRAVM